MDNNNFSESKEKSSSKYNIIHHEGNQLVFNSKVSIKKTNKFNNPKINYFKDSLEIIMQRYYEEERRNERIDRKNSIFIGIIGVMLTIQISFVPDIFSKGFCLDLGNICIIGTYIGSLIFYVISIKKFISSLYYKEFSFAPGLKDMSKNINDNVDEINILKECIDDCFKAIEDNDEVLNSKISKSEKGIKYLELGLIILILFVILVIIQNILVLL